MKVPSQRYPEVGAQPTAELPIGLALDLGPYVETENILVNQSAARRQLRIAGFSTAIIGVGGQELFRQEEPPEQKVSIMGIGGLSGASATALGGLLRPRRDKRQTEHSGMQKQGGSGSPYGYYDWPAVRIDVNKGLIAQRIAAKTSTRSKTITEGWVDELNNAYRKGIWREAKNNLTLPFNQVPNIYLAAFNIYFGTNEAGAVWQATQGHYTEALQNTRSLAMLYGLLVGIEVYRNKQATGDSLIRERRWGALPFGLQQFDRLAVAGLALQIDKPIFSIAPAKAT